MKAEITGLPMDLTDDQQLMIGRALLGALNAHGVNVNDVQVKWNRFDKLKQGEGQGFYRIYERLPDIGLGKLIRLWGTTDDRVLMSKCAEGFDGREFIVVTRDYYNHLGVPVKYTVVMT